MGELQNIEDEYGVDDVNMSENLKVVDTREFNQLGIIASTVLNAFGSNQVQCTYYIRYQFKFFE